MDFGSDPKGLIEGFIHTRVEGRGLDGRTEKAYRLDLQHFYRWLEQRQLSGAGYEEMVWKEEMEAYLNHLIYERGLRLSTINRKRRVLSYYLAYLAKRGNPLECQVVKPVLAKAAPPKPCDLLSKNEVDAFFLALNREYMELDSPFRKRVCLRDLVMMRLLFYYGIEISELLRMEEGDYNKNTGILIVRRKRDRDYSVYLFSRILREQMELWLEERVYFERDDRYESFMFLSKLGRPLSMKMVIMIFDKYRVMAGIEKEFTPKDLKKSMERYAQELVIEQFGQQEG